MIMPKSTQTRPVVVGMITSIRDIPTSLFLLNSVSYVYGLTCNVCHEPDDARCIFLYDVMHNLRQTLHISPHEFSFLKKYVGTSLVP